MSNRYHEWLNDKEVVLYSDNQYKKFTKEDQIKYITSITNSKNTMLYGIFKENLHIGNIQISNIDSVNKRAEVSYLIGEKKYWGKGVASYAISEIINIARDKLKLNRLYAGVASQNIASAKALKKNGFSLEAIQKEHLIYNNTFCDKYTYGMIL